MPPREPEPVSNTWPIAKVQSNPSPRPSASTSRTQGSYNERKPSFKAPSFKAGSGNAIAASPPASMKKRPFSPTKKVHPEAKLSRELWDEAYDALRLDPSTSSLVVTYESIISQELPDDLKAAAHATLSPASGDTDHRMNLMTEIARAGLRKRRGSKTSQVEDIARTFLEQSKRIVEAQIDDFPVAALSWSGICVLTPVSHSIILSVCSFAETSHSFFSILFCGTTNFGVAWFTLLAAFPGTCISLISYNVLHGSMPTTSRPVSTSSSLAAIARGTLSCVCIGECWSSR